MDEERAPIPHLHPGMEEGELNSVGASQVRRGPGSAHPRGAQPCVVRYVKEGVACAFSSSVIGSTRTRSGGQVRLSWPDRVEFQALRRFERVPFEAPCKIVRGDGSCCEGDFRDLSKGGCGLLTKAPLAKEESLELQFTFPDGVEVRGLRAHVRTLNVKAETRFLGCEFEPDQDIVKNSINFYLGMEVARVRSGVEILASNKRVMIVDSDPSSVEELNAQLADHPIEIHCYSCAVDALYALRAMPFHAVAVNHELKDLPGVELCRLIRTSMGVDKLLVFLYGGSESSIEAVLQLQLNRWCPTSRSMAIELAREITQSLEPAPVERIA